MKHLILAAALLPLAWTGASAQGVYIGPGGVGVDTGIHARHREVIRQYEESNGCTVRVVRDRRPDGDVVIRHMRDCD